MTPQLPFRRPGGWCSQRNGERELGVPSRDEDKLGKAKLGSRHFLNYHSSYSDSHSHLLLIKYDAFHSVIMVKNHCPLLEINNLSN